MYMRIIPTFIVTANKQGKPPIKMRVSEDDLEVYFHILRFNDYEEIHTKRDQSIPGIQQQWTDDEEQSG